MAGTDWPHSLLESWRLPCGRERIEPQVVGIAGAQRRRQPRRPSETPLPAEFERRDLLALQDEVHIPIELVADIAAHERHEAAQALAPGQQAQILREAQRAEGDAELVVAAPNARTDRRGLPERAAGTRTAEPPPHVFAQMQPARRELADRHGHAEEIPQDGAEPGAVARLVREEPGIAQPRQVRKRIAVAQRRHARAEERCDIDGETIVFWPVEAHRW